MWARLTSCTAAGADFIGKAIFMLVLQFPLLLLTLGSLAVETTSPPRPATEAARQASQRLGQSINVWRWFNRPELETSEHYRAYLSDDDIRSLRSAGFTGVRLAVGGAFLFDDPDGVAVPKMERLRILLDAIDRLNKAGLAVSIDYHPRGPLKSRLESDPALRQRVIDMWATLSKALSTTDPRMVFFEILNEPRFIGKSDDWNDLASRIFLAIRSYSPSHIVIVSSAEYGSLETLELLNPKTDGNVIYTVHFYEPHGFTGQGADFMPAGFRGIKWPLDDHQCSPYRGGGYGGMLSKFRHKANNRKTVSEISGEYCSGHWNLAKMASQVAGIAKLSRERKIPVWIGEFGVRASDAPYSDRLNWLRSASSAFKRENLPWALWSYDDCFGLAANAHCVLRYPPSRSFPNLTCDTLDSLGLRSADTRWCKADIAGSLSK
jgi:endoglucanase